MFRIHRTVPSSRAHAAAARSIWTTTTRTCSDPEALLGSIAPPAAASSTSSAPTFTLYTVSKHFPQALLPKLQAKIAQVSPSIGTLSEPNPHSTRAAASSDVPPFTLSLAHWTRSSPTESIVPFSTSLTGRPNVSLGREHKPRAGGRATEEELEFENRQFEKFLNGDKNWAFGDQAGIDSNASNASASPTGIDELKHVRPQDVKEIVCFTADRIQPFLSALSQFPHSSTLGMTSTSTPFHSPHNLPFSLFRDDRVSSAGAVGVAVVDTSKASNTLESRVAIDYGNLTRFGPITTVSSSRGNIVLLLSSKNAAQLLLNSVQSLPSSSTYLGESYDSSSPFEASLSNPNERSTRHISKDKDFFAAIFDPTDLPDSTTLDSVIDLGKSKLVCRIMAGDPKRGAVSFETEEEIRTGDKVVFLHRPTSSSQAEEAHPTSSQSHAFRFETIQPSYVSPIESHDPATTESSGHVEIKSGFEAFTENGIIVSRLSDAGERSGIEVRLASIEGTSVTLNQ
ncbi:uncharacterized protein JCM15063_005437 [Sporobolomyces koalae]|uniref:uncharacterized protein n=1 Tax=Sporobolomyces koalae TaxID=500713 RepID=UPI0031778330